MIASHTFRNAAHRTGFISSWRAGEATADAKDDAMTGCLASLRRVLWKQPCQYNSGDEINDDDGRGYDHDGGIHRRFPFHPLSPNDRAISAVTSQVRVVAGVKRQKVRFGIWK
jgi:hypothetical protein